MIKSTTDKAASEIPPDRSSFEFIVKAKLMTLDLYLFGQEAWKYVYGSEHVPSKHQELLAKHCQRLHHEEGISRLLVNLPPYHGVSIWASVILPAWVFTRAPSARIELYTQCESLYSADIAKCKALMQTRWYRTYFPSVKIRSGGKLKSEFRIVGGGGFAGAIPGDSKNMRTRPDLAILCDPQSEAQTCSSFARTSLSDWFRARFGDAGTARNSKVLVSQSRINGSDLSAEIVKQYLKELEQHGTTAWVHWCQPMRYTSHMPVCLSPFGREWRSVDGELLFPEMMDESKAAKLTLKLLRKSPKTAEAQLQQIVR